MDPSLAANGVCAGLAGVVLAASLDRRAEDVLATLEPDAGGLVSAQDDAQDGRLRS
jgi:hypothetical protein